MTGKKINFRWLLIVTSLLPFIVIQCRPGGSAAVFSSLDSLAGQQEFFQLEDAFANRKTFLDNGQQLYFRIFLNNAFNRNELALKETDSLLRQYPGEFADSQKAALLQVQEDSYFKTCRYGKAASADSLLVHTYAHVLDSSTLEDRKNKYRLTSALRAIPPQFIEKTQATDIPWKRNRVGLISIPLRHDTGTFDAIFDTRANISSITETYAKKLQLKVLPVTYEESSGATGIHFKTGLGVADSLYIGDVLIKNAIFQVMPDSVLYIKPLKISLDVILGFPVIAGLGEIHIVKDGRMIIPKYEMKSTLRNLSLHQLDPVVLLKTGKDSLPFNFDLGASTTDLYFAFFQKYRSRIEKDAVKRQIQLGGAGGLQAKTVYVLPSLPLTLSGKTVTIDSVSVFTSKIYPGEKVFGNIGNDFSSQFADLVLNFKQMYLEGR